MYVSTGPLLLRDMISFFPSRRKFPISFTHPMCSPTQDGMLKGLVSLQGLTSSLGEQVGPGYFNSWFLLHVKQS